jgi:hypothetical protein
MIEFDESEIYLANYHMALIAIRDALKHGIWSAPAAELETFWEDMTGIPATKVWETDDDTLMEAIRGA